MGSTVSSLVFFGDGVLEGLESLAPGKGRTDRYGLLLGSFSQAGEASHVVVERSVEVRVTGKTPFESAVWERFAKEQKQKHPEMEIVGWYQTHFNYGVFLSDEARRFHQDTFGAKHQIVVVVDPESKDAGLFLWHAGALKQTPVRRNAEHKQQRIPSLRTKRGRVDLRIWIGLLLGLLLGVFGTHFATKSNGEVTPTLTREISQVLMEETFIARMQLYLEDALSQGTEELSHSIKRLEGKVDEVQKAQGMVDEMVVLRETLQALLNGEGSSLFREEMLERLNFLEEGLESLSGGVPGADLTILQGEITDLLTYLRELKDWMSSMERFQQELQQLAGLLTEGTVLNARMGELSESLGTLAPMLVALAEDQSLKQEHFLEWEETLLSLEERLVAAVKPEWVLFEQNLNQVVKQSKEYLDKELEEILARFEARLVFAPLEGTEQNVSSNRFLEPSADPRLSYSGLVWTWQVVRRGDTLSELLNLRGVSNMWLAEVLERNNLGDSDTIFAGDRIMLPSFSVY